MKNIKLLTLCALLSFFWSASQVPLDHIKFKQMYRLKNNTEIYVPLGNVAFADAIFSFREGEPKALKKYTNPKAALGEPDYKKYLDQSYVSIGCKGELIVAFTDNGFIDIEGPDLYFFEIGPSVEAFEVAISSDAKEWVTIGRVEGGESQIDIASAVEKEEEKKIYYYVKIKDLASFCSGPTAGADIDAVGTIGAVLKLNVKAHLLFDTDSHNLKSQALNKLNDFIDIIKKIPKAQIVIAGHTDSDASSRYNHNLGLNRAREVEKFLKFKLNPLGAYRFKSESYGEQKPVAPNDTPSNKQKNRRVEIIVLPHESFYKAP